MNEYPKFLSLPYRVYTGKEVLSADVYPHGDLAPERMGIEWTYRRSFSSESTASHYARSLATYNTHVKIERKEEETE